MQTVYIALGSNLKNPVQQITNAIAALQNLPHTQFILASQLYSSAPLGPQEQADFINAVATLQTTLTAPVLLQHLLTIENQQGRKRDGVRWGARTLDLDLLLYGNEIINTPELTVPHPGIKTREFVLYPLAEIAPDLVLPTGETVGDLLAQCPKIAVKLAEMSS